MYLNLTYELQVTLLPIGSGIRRYDHQNNQQSHYSQHFWLMLCYPAVHTLVLSAASLYTIFNRAVKSLHAKHDTIMSPRMFIYS